MAVARLSRRLGLGEGSIIGGRVILALQPGALRALGANRRIVVVSGTNGKTTTSHLLAAALRTEGAVAHNSTGSNMGDGAAAALAALPDAPFAVLEADELHLAAITGAVRPEVVVLLNLTRDQLDRGNEVRAVAAAVGTALAANPDTTVVANADDPMIVFAARQAERVVWVGAGAGWSADTGTCPRCGELLREPAGPQPRWGCACGLIRPSPDWTAEAGAVVTPGGAVDLPLRLPGRFNLGNAAMAMAAAAHLGVTPARAATAMSEVAAVAGRYATIRHGRHELRMLLAKNPAGWAETLSLLGGGPLVLVVNAREADGRDTSWLWDVEFERLGSRPVLACGERAADLGVRLSYAEIEHRTVSDPLAALVDLSPGQVDVVANYTAFRHLRRRLDR
jgi:UDP-N-acetylmuramyl tripeptide synthase